MNLFLSDATFHEIADELAKAGHLEAIILEKDRSVSLDMSGIICLLRREDNVIDLPERN